MRAALLTMFYCMALCATATCQDQLLKDFFANKTLYIRNFYLGSSLEYDESGHIKHSRDKGEWTTAQFLVEKIKSNGSSFELTGKRLALGYDNKRDAVIFYTLGALSLKVNTPATAITQAKLDELSYQIFVDLKKEPEQVPDYWRDIVSGNVAGEMGKGGKKTYRLKDVPPWNPDAPKDSVQVVSNTPQDPLYLLGGKLALPKPIKTPDPDYSDMARRYRYKGTTGMMIIINEEGRVENPRIIQPLGFGLDESAVQAVKKWTFKPATLDGKPVRVFLKIEVSFELR